MDEVPIKSLMHSHITGLKESLNEFLSVVECSLNGKTSTKSAQEIDRAMTRLHGSYNDLLVAVSHLHQHQAFQRKIFEVQNSIMEADKSIITLSDTMREIQDGVESEIFEKAKPLIFNSISTNAVDTEQVLLLAKKLSYSTSAPRGWFPGIQIPLPYRPPAPQEERIKQGILFTSVETLLEGLREVRKLRGEEGDPQEEEEEEGEEDDEEQEEKPKTKRGKKDKEDLSSKNSEDDLASKASGDNDDTEMKSPRGSRRLSSRNTSSESAVKRKAPVATRSSKRRRSTASQNE